MKGHQQPTGRAQSLLSSAFPIIILLDNSLSSTLKVLVDGPGAQNGSLGELPGFAVNSGTSTLANSLHGLEGYVLHLCVVKSVHLALQMTCLHLWLCVAFCAWLTS